MLIVFRADASLHMGSGHVMRCLTLAHELRNRGHRCLFVSRKQNGDMLETIESHGYSVYELAGYGFPNDDHEEKSEWLPNGWHSDLNASKKLIDKLCPDWMVIDHYGLDTRWEAEARQSAGNLVVIDDLADRDHDCDILVDQNLGRSEADYKVRTPEECLLLLGCRYSLLRPEFAKLRTESLAYRDREKTVERILISMGGADNDNYTGKVLEALESSDLDNSVEIVVVIGQANPWEERLNVQRKNSRLNVRILKNISNMGELMSCSDFAIGAAGSTSWERCCLGVPAIMCVLADNQKYVARSLVQHGAALLVDEKTFNESLKNQINLLVNEKNRLAEMSARARELVDGQGVGRVAEAMENLHVR